mgnify:CR=1 FL=1
MSKESSTCFTYKVELIVQVLAPDEVSAKEFLDKTGGYIVSRNANLIDSAAVYESKD